MTPDELEEYRARLDKLRDDLKAESAASAEDSAPVELDQSRVGRLSRMDAMQQQAMAQEQKRRRELQLTRIEGAFIRLERGTFGQCAKCGTEIDPRRLDFDPAIFFCTACAEAAKR